MGKHCKRQPMPQHLRREMNAYSARSRAAQIKHIKRQRRIALRDHRNLKRELCQRYGHRCAACGTQERLTLDHILPVGFGGRTVIDNLQILCADCNKTKGAWVMDFRPEVA